jgi:hypothetical protein
VLHAERAYQACNAAGDVAWYDSCHHELDVLDDCVDGAAGGACDGGVCGCQPGRKGADCASCVVRVALWGDDANTGATWDEAMRTVQAGIDTAESSSCAVWVAIGT